jgi:prepilin-type N-terminal cleavage/methylation domain-containing protein
MNDVSNKQGSQQAFTLIEILVVVAIVGLLGTIILTALSNARLKGRDAKRISDLNTISKALELYLDENGFYPPSPAGYDGPGYAYSYETSGSWADLETELAPYLIQLPTDPLNNNCAPWNENCYSYSYGNVGRDTYEDQYDLTAALEDPNSYWRCEIQNYVFYFTSSDWCQWGNNLYEVTSTC